MYLFKLTFSRFVYVVELLILVRIFISFIIRDLNNPIVNFIYQVTEPILAPIRSLINKTGIKTGMFDFSPLIAFLLLGFINRIIQSL